MRIFILFIILFCTLVFFLRSDDINASEAISAHVQLSTDGPYTFIANKINVKQADEAKIITSFPVKISEGVNDFILKLPQGTAAISITAPGIDVTGDGWKIAAAEHDVNKGKRLSIDSEWEIVKRIGESKSLGPIVGKPNQHTELHRTILYKHTKVWPSPLPAFFLPINATMPLNLIVGGIAGRNLHNWTTYIALPADIECLGSSGFYGNTAVNQPTFKMNRMGSIKIDGKPHDHYRISADKPIVSQKHDVMKIVQIFLRYKGSSNPISGDRTIYYWSEANGGVVVEVRQSIPVRIIAGLSGRQPLKYVFQIYGGYIGNLDNLDMSQAILQTFKLAGFNRVLCSTKWCSQNAPAYGLQNIMSLTFAPWSINLSGYLKDVPHDRLLKSNGTYSDEFMCTSKMLDDRWHIVEQILAKKLNQVKPHVVEYDYEYPPFTGPHTCYCPICLKQFRIFAGISEGVKLNTETLKKTFSLQWADFMARRAARLFLQFKGSIHKLSPGTTFGVYSGCHTPDNAKRYGVDWRYIGELQAVDQAGCGYGQLPAVSKDTIRALQGIPLIGGVIVTPYDIKEARPATELTPATVLKQFFHSTGGILAYSYMEMGGRSYQAVSQVSKFVSSFEEVLWQGDRFSLKGYDEEEVIGIKYGRTTLICLMNNKISPRYFMLKIPYAGKDGFLFFKDQKLDKSDKIDCILDPGQIEILVFNSLNSGLD